MLDDRYILSYFGLLVCLIVYCLNQQGYLHLLREILQQASFYEEMIAEIMLSCVVLGDILAVSISAASMG